MMPQPRTQLELGKPEENELVEEQKSPPSMSLDFGRMKPVKSEGVSFGYICFRTTRSPQSAGESRKSRFYFVCVRDLLTETTTSRYWPSFELCPSNPSAEFHRLSMCSPFALTSLTAYPPIYASPEIPPHLSSTYSTAVFQYPYMYLIGSAIDHTTDVYVLNLLSTHRGWEKLNPSFKYQKWIPKAISIGSEIYVFGSSVVSSNGRRSADGFVDVYNTTHNSWTSIDSGPHAFDAEPLVVPLENLDTKQKYILLHEYDEGSLYVYDLTEKSMTLVSQRVVQVDNQAAVLNGVLYCYKHPRVDTGGIETYTGEVVGYDLNSGNKDVWRTPITVLGLSEHLTFPVSDVHLLGIDNNILCAICGYDTRCRDGYGLKIVKCSYFRMSVQRRFYGTVFDPDEASVLIQAHHLYTRAYAVPGSSEVVDCLVL